MSKQVSASSSGREIAPPHGSEHDCDAVSGERSSFSASTGGTTDSKYAYKDFSRVLPDDGEAVLDAIVNVGPSNVKHQKLPVKLDAMLSDPEFSHIISWMPHGRSWRILKPKTFVKEVLPKYFDYCNYNSFIRLVNAWGFRRFTSGPDRHSYYHEVSFYFTRESHSSFEN